MPCRLERQRHGRQPRPLDSARRLRRNVRRRRLARPHLVRNPLQPSTQQGTDSDHEFLELTNPHPFDLHLGGWSIADGIDCAFPPDTWVEAGGHLVVANNPDTLGALVPDFTPVLGWSGASGLHNSGETLRLVRPDGSVAQTVAYSDTNGWPEVADGGGASLEWLGTPHDNAMPTSWVASSTLGGSPGSPNSTWAD